MDRLTILQLDRIERKLDILLELEEITLNEQGEIEEKKEQKNIKEK